MQVTMRNWLSLRRSPTLFGTTSTFPRQLRHFKSWPTFSTNKLGARKSGSFVDVKCFSVGTHSNQPLRYASHHEMYPIGMVAPRAHHSGRMKSAASPSTVNESQKILRSILWIVGLLRYT